MMKLKKFKSMLQKILDLKLSTTHSTFTLIALKNLVLVGLEEKQILKNVIKRILNLVFLLHAAK